MKDPYVVSNYTPRPVKGVQAVQFSGDNINEVMKLLGDKFSSFTRITKFDSEVTYYTMDNGSRSQVREIIYAGDYIVKHPELDPRRVSSKEFKILYK